jgi:hypothetical protein
MARAQIAAVALYLCYLKRVGAHLLNILSSVVSLFVRIGYREQDYTTLRGLRLTWGIPKGAKL